MPKKKSISPTIQRSLVVLIIFLMGISIARLLTSMHQQQERIEMLEASVAQLLADTTRLQIPSAYNGYGRDSYYSQHDYYPRHHSGYRHDERAYHPQSLAASPSHDAAPGLPGATPAGSLGGDTTTHQDLPPATPPNLSGNRPHKFTEPHLFDLNTVDSVTLIRIPGIASQTASVILRNRQRYGGFHHASQIREFLTWDAALAYLDDWCNLWFTADANRLVHIPINTATVSQLQRHPYISHEQAVEIVRYRQRHRRLDDALQLSELTTFDNSQISLLLPYLSFD